MAKEHDQPRQPQRLADPAPVATADPAILDRLAALEKELAEARAQLQGARIDQKADATIDDKAREFERWANLSTREKSQIVADKHFPPREGAKRFRGRLESRRLPKGPNDPWKPNPAFPELEFHAASSMEAEVIYQKLCGITTVRSDEVDQNRITVELIAA